MKLQYKKISVWVLVAAVVFSCVGCSVKQEEAQEQKVIATKEKEVADVKTSGNNVYVFTNDKDEVKKIVASDDVLDAISDTTLKKDENLLGLESQLPITIETTYYLDGKKMSKKELEGKSGDLLIRYDYHNHQQEQVIIDGQKKAMYIPYVMLAGCILDDENFSNVSITNGKMIDDGNHTILLGLALPGLADNLAINSKDVNLPSSIEIHATMKNYQPVETITMATNKVFQDIKLDDQLSLDGMSDKLRQLDDAMNQLIDGSEQLYNGLSLLDEKSATLSAGVNALCNGAHQLEDGSNQLYQGSQQLALGATSLYQGLETLCGNNEALQTGAKEVFDTLLATANEQLAKNGVAMPALTIANYDQVLTNVIASLDQDQVYQHALDEVTKEVNKNRTLIEAKVSEVVEGQVRQQVLAGVQSEVSKEVEKQMRAKVREEIIASQLHMSVAQYEQALQLGLISKEVDQKVQMATKEMMASAEMQVKKQTLIDTKMQSKEVQMMIENMTKQQMQSEKVKAIIKEQTDLQVASKIAEIMDSDEMKANFAKAQEGLKQVIALKTSLNKYDVFYKGILQYTNGVAAALQGSAQLKDGMSTLEDASKQVHDGASQLQAGLFSMQQQMPVLVGGVHDLKDGSKQLVSGLNQFNEEGIQQIVKAVDGDVKGFAQRLEACIKVSKEHESFAGVSRDVDRELVFIYK